jgi:hypothetical protein
MLFVYARRWWLEPGDRRSAPGAIAAAYSYSTDPIFSSSIWGHGLGRHLGILGGLYALARGCEAASLAAVVAAHQIQFGWLIPIVIVGLKRHLFGRSAVPGSPIGAISRVLGSLAVGVGAMVLLICRSA